MNAGGGNSICVFSLKEEFVMNNADIVIRRAKADDFVAIAAISRNDLGYDCTDILVKSKLTALDDAREAVFVAEYNNKNVCGYVHIEKYDVLYCETFANVLGLAVSGNTRHLGIGKKLMETAEEWAKSIGAKAVRLNSGFSRTGAHEFYRSIGYNNEKNQIRFLKYF